jgi:hypothetical protein
MRLRRVGSYDANFRPSITLNPEVPLKNFTPHFLRDSGATQKLAFLLNPHFLILNWNPRQRLLREKLRREPAVMPNRLAQRRSTHLKPTAHFT